MVPSGCSASAWGSCSICAPSSRLPARRPLAWERWVLELGARGARPARWMSFPSAVPPKAAVAVQLPCCGGALPGSCVELCCAGVGDGAQRRSGCGPCLAPMARHGAGAPALLTDGLGAGLGLQPQAAGARAERGAAYAPVPAPAGGESLPRPQLQGSRDPLRPGDPSGLLPPTQPLVGSRRCCCRPASPAASGWVLHRH